MTVGLKYIESQINSRILSGGLDELDAAQLAKSINSIESSLVSKVSTTSALPPAAQNRGRLIFVEDIGAYRYSNGSAWINDFSSSYCCIGRTLFMSGYNSWGLLGDGTFVNKSSPVTTAGGGSTWKMASINYISSAIKTDGTLWTWGNRYGTGQLGDGIGAGFRSSPGTTAGGGTNWCLVSAGVSASAAIKTDGTLWTWGRNQYGQLGDGTTTGKCSPITTACGGENWCHVDTGIRGMLAIKTDGTLWGWGNNYAGSIAIGTNYSQNAVPQQICGAGTTWCLANISHSSSAGIKTDGTLWTWGCNNCGQLGTGTTTSRSSPGTTAGGGTDWSKVSVSRCHSLAIKTDGTLWTWGINNCGQLGDGTTTNRSSPVTTASGGTNWASISSNMNSNMALKTDGTLWAWGQNMCGLFGDGNSGTYSATPKFLDNPLVGSWVQASVGVGASARISLVSKGF